MFNRNEIGDVNVMPSRIAHPWTAMEEYSPNGGMWAIPLQRDRALHIRRSADLMANPDAFLAACRVATSKWQLSCEVAFTTPGMNHKAWLGHAACFLATGSPEETTRMGWHELDAGEQYSANAAADRVIAEWRHANAVADGQLVMTFGEDDA